ncbi:MAG TPA: RDD family protein [Chitinophagaceae bacterium]
MGAIRVPTTFNIDLEFEIPEFHRRLFAWLIDVLIQIIYFKVAVTILNRSISTSDFFNEDSAYNLQALRLMLFIPIFTYHLICEITMNGQSIGKKILGIRVVNENGGRPSLSQFIIRWLIRTGDYTIYIILMLNVFILINRELLLFLGASLLLLLADIILVVSSKKSQRLGDILAHTILVRTAARGSMEETIFMEVADSYIPVFPQIMKLSDRDINAIKSILDTARKKGDFNLAAMASEKVKSHLDINTPMSPFDFLDTLLKDYNYLSVK